MEDCDWTETENGKENLSCCDWIQPGDWKLSLMLVAGSRNMYLDHKDYIHNQQHTYDIQGEIVEISILQLKNKTQPMLDTDILWNKP